MNIRELVENAIKYPLLDRKKIILLGVIILINSISLNVLMLVENLELIVIFGLIGLLSSILMSGYLFRILKPSLTNAQELPQFNDWNDMLIDGIRVFLISIIYLIPVICLIVISFSESFTNVLGIIISNPPTIVFNVIWGIIGGLTFLDMSYAIILLYIILIIPVIYLGIANMANNDKKISMAFKIRDIINEIALFGWGTFVGWYLSTCFVLLLIIIIGIITGVLNLIHPTFSILLLSLIIAPYFYIYLYRTIGLVYHSE